MYIQSYPQGQQYGFGSWLKENAGTIGQIAGGVGGFVLGGPAGAALGASALGSVGGTISQGEQMNQQQQAQAQQVSSMQQQQARQNALSQLQPQQQYASNFACGGKMNYNGGVINSYPDGGSLSYGPGRGQQGPGFEALTSEKEVGLTPVSTFLRAKRHGLIPQDFKRSDFEKDSTGMHQYLDKSGGSFTYRPNEKGGFDYFKRASDIQITKEDMPAAREAGYDIKGESVYANGGYMEETRNNPDVKGYGGNIDTSNNPMVSTIDSGSSHGNNIYGGVPIGSTGNTVEEGEVIANIGNNKYVFSNRF